MIFHSFCSIRINFNYFYVFLVRIKKNRYLCNINIDNKADMKIIQFITGLMGLTVSCASSSQNSNSEMKTERLTYFSYDHHNSMSMSGEKYDVSCTEDGRVHVVIDEALASEKEFYLADSTIFDELLDLVKTYKMDKYKENYKPKARIFDGDSWSLYYRYDTKRRVSSGGYMAWPDNYREMRKALSDYFRKWRDYQEGVLVMDYFKFTCKNNKGSDIEYTLERGDKEATMTIRDKEENIDKTLNVSNDILRELQEKANSAQLKNKDYDYYTEDEDATRCTYFVRYSTGDTISGITCHTKYPSHKVTTILGFFKRWK